MRTDRVKLGDDGRIVIPAAARQELGFAPGDILILESDGDSLLVRSHHTVVQEVQNYFKQFATPGKSMVDELIADRREEFALEQAKEARLEASLSKPSRD